MSRWGGFKRGRKIFDSWLQHRSPNVNSETPPETTQDFKYTDAQGIWTLKSTFMFPAGESSSFGPFTFDSCDEYGYRGPSLSDALAYYDTSTYSWLSDTNSYNIQTEGIQEWTVPFSGNYTLQAKGARGGKAYLLSTGTYSTPGKGADITATFALTAGDVIKILVGQRSPDNATNNRGAGGGGGTFVYNSTTETLLMAAGGGGGSGQYNNGTRDANPSGTSGYNGSTSGSATGGGAGGTSGAGGSTVNYGGGGAGWLSNGQTGSYGFGAFRFLDSTYPGYGGKNYNNTWSNLVDGSHTNGVVGGFGGGGGCYAGSGGGGGYSGGGGGQWSYSGSGGGGGSYIDSSASATGTLTNHTDDNGSVTIEKV